MTTQPVGWVCSPGRTQARQVQSSRAFCFLLMPTTPARPCKHQGCAALVRDGSGYCATHQRPRPGSFADPTRGNRHERGYGTEWDKRRLRIRRRDNDLCQECLRQGRITGVGDKPFSAFCDHIVPKVDGGTDADENLQTLCRACHTAKTDREKNRGRGG